jgi:predicted AAA+ superfamily ATPase
VDELPLLEKLLTFIGRSQVDGINYSTLSRNLGITKYKAEQYAEAFEQAFVLQRLFPAGTNVLREPKVLLMPPIRLLHRPMDEVEGGLREDFFAMAMRQAGIPIQYLKSTTGKKTPDFLIQHRDRKLFLKSAARVRPFPNSKACKPIRKIILAPDIAPTQDQIPLHLMGFLS